MKTGTRAAARERSSLDWCAQSCREVILCQFIKCQGRQKARQAGGAWPSPVVAARQLKIERGNHNCTLFLAQLLIT